MTEHPILFSAPMVRAILAGTKTQTRRVVKPQPAADTYTVSTYHHPDPRPHFWAWTNSPTRPECANLSDWCRPCPYGQPDDRLWVRETFMDLRGTGVEHRPDPRGPLQRYAYQADTPPGSFGDEARKEYGLKWKPCIHMPRLASRITLEITGVRVERLQAISEADAQAEGIFFTDYGIGRWQQQNPGWMWDKTTSHSQCLISPVHAFGNLWNHVNGDDAWAANPWVWVVEFRRIQSPA